MLWAEKAIEIVKYFKYFKLYEFWLGNVASCWVPCVHRRRKVLRRNESNADRQLRKKFFGTFREEWTLYWFFSLFARHDSLRLCCAPWSGKPNGALKCGDFCFSSPFAAQARAACPLNALVSVWLIDRNKLSVLLHRWLLYSRVTPTIPTEALLVCTFFPPAIIIIT